MSATSFDLGRLVLIFLKALHVDEMSSEVRVDDDYADVVCRSYRWMSGSY